jgi:alpha-1,3-rhamnosyl/mannosyltransferase
MTWRAASAALARHTLSRVKDYVLHGPGFYLPSFAGRSVVTVHDLSIFRHPAHHPAARVRFMRSEIGVALRRADHVITDSEFTKRELMDVFRWPAERATAIPLAAGSEFHPREAAELAEFLARYRLRYGGYCLFVGTLEPRKNLGTLIDAYQHLPLATRQRWPLVLAGFRGWESDSLHGRIRAAQSQGWLHYLGFLPAVELPLLYSAARLFVYPSMYEGFGLPVLEAMASGVPVLCARGSALTEVAGTAARLMEADDSEGLGAHIAVLLEDSVLLASMRGAGLAWARRFTWQRCAELTAAVYCTL